MLRPCNRSEFDGCEDNGEVWVPEESRWGRWEETGVRTQQKDHLGSAGRAEVGFYFQC